MGTERMVQAGSIRLRFAPFPDRGRVVGYPLDEFAIETFNRGRSSRSFGDRGRREGREGARHRTNNAPQRGASHGRYLERGTNKQGVVRPFHAWVFLEKVQSVSNEKVAKNGCKKKGCNACININEQNERALIFGRMFSPSGQTHVKAGRP